MRIKVLTLAAVSSLSLLASAAPALAGGCMSGGPSCDMGVKVMPSAPAQFGPMTVQTAHPMGHLRHVEFQRAPHVSITRVHGMMPTADLSDAPSGFTKGCHPTSTQYCRTDVGTPVSVDMAPAPIVAAPYAAPAPVIAQPLRSYTGQGYDPSKFAPRQYGDASFVPGIAHVPTSYVDRSPSNAQAVLDAPAVGGVTLPGTYSQRVTLPGTMSPSMGMGSVGYSAPAMGRVTLPGTMAPSMAMGSVGYSAPMMPAPMPAPMMPAPMMGGQATAPVLTQNGTYASNVSADGTYWEKTSGPTMFGNTMATQVICKRKLPTQVVRPVVNVPYPVPTPAPTCGPGSYAAPAGPVARYEQAPKGRWTY